jgi:hypothetical protein
MCIRDRLVVIDGAENNVDRLGYDPEMIEKISGCPLGKGI